jgi:catalase
MHREPSPVHRASNDDNTQPGDLFRLMSLSQKRQLFGNIAAAMQGVPEEIVRRRLGHFAKAGPAYAAGTAKVLGIKP